MGKVVMFEVHYHHQWKHFEMLPFLLLGAFGGLLGAAFNKFHLTLVRWRRTAALDDSPVTEAALLSFLSGGKSICVRVCASCATEAALRSFLFFKLLPPSSSSFLSATLQYHAVYLRGSATGLLAALFSENCARARTATAPAAAGM